MGRRAALPLSSCKICSAEQNSALLVRQTALFLLKTTQARQLEKSQELVTSTTNMSKIHEKECFWKVIVVFYELLHSFLLNHFTLEMHSLYNISVSPYYADLNTFLSVSMFYRIPSPKSKSDLLLLHINAIGRAKNKCHKLSEIWVPKGSTI